ncbi:MAG: YbfB/YjiJ family MFS transporter [Aliarcobacter sp.]|jgi:predicted MFS family arabinose efflux permease|nr:YbfB/YjiJ family MFS transporter [Aliarcobacter sp.]MBP7224991.1 YbfB/YjiJ family MFS transporter [Aliarcobacter sp.]MDX9960270.1 YbfB/YjiJ family MFS transporter [Aliarcobacter sp.]
MNLLDRNSNFNILLAGIIGLFIGVGVARFSYTSLLPSMLADNTLSLTFSGILASINYVGYLSGSIFAIFIKDINTKVKYFRLGIILCILTTIIMGVTTNEILWLLGRVIAGFGAAMALVVGAAIVMTKLNFQDKTKAMGIYFSGIGIALASSDIISRYVLSFSSWQNSWIVLTFCAIAVAAYPLYILSFDKEISQKNEKHPFNKALFSPFVVVLIVAYFTEGVGFVIQGTFLPTILKSIEGLESVAGLSWLLVGLAGIPSSIIWMRLAHKYGSVNIIIIAMSLQIVGILIPTFSTNMYLNLFSGILYGATFVGLVALFMNLGGKLAASNPVMLMGALTTAYGIGQVTAPLYAVSLTHLTGNYNYALYLTAAIVLFGVLILLLAKKVTQNSNH